MVTGTSGGVAFSMEVKRNTEDITVTVIVGVWVAESAKKREQ